MQFDEAYWTVRLSRCSVYAKPVFPMQSYKLLLCILATCARPNGRSDLQLVGSFVVSSFLITISDRLIFHNLWIPKLLIYLLGRHVGLKRINYTTNKFYWNQRLFFFWQQRKVWFVFNQKMEKRIFIRRILFLFNFFYFIIE